MSIWSHGRELGSRRRRVALWALLGALPLLGLIYQFAAKQAAAALARVAFGPAWFVALVHSPWAQALLVFELISFAAWMAVLAEMKLSAAFPMSALSYVFVVVMGWTYFHEHVTALQVIGGAAILAGVWMIGSDGPTGAPGAD